MHRRQFTPGSQHKLNRTRLHAEVKRLRKVRAELETNVSHRDEMLAEWNRFAIARGWKALLAALRKFFTKPIQIRNRKAAA